MIRDATRNLLLDAAEALFETQPIQSISVQSIVDRCGTTRTTFYRYFKDKYDIMNCVYKRHVDGIIQNYVSSDSVKQMYRDILDYLASRKQYYFSIAKYSGQNSFHDYFVAYGVEFYEKRILCKTGEDAVPERINMLIRGYCHGAAYLSMDWLNKSCTICANELADILIELAPPQIAEYLF